MDKMTERLFEILYDYNSTEKYRVVSFEDILAKWEGLSQIEQLIDELIDDGFIAVKYRDKENICYICQKKPAKSAATEVVKQQTKTKWVNYLLHFVITFVASFLAMIAALYLIK